MEERHVWILCDGDEKHTEDLAGTAARALPRGSRLHAHIVPIQNLQSAKAPAPSGILCLEPPTDAPSPLGSLPPVPVVEAILGSPSFGKHVICPDHDAVGKLAALHLRDRLFSRLALLTHRAAEHETRIASAAATSLNEPLPAEFVMARSPEKSRDRALDRWLSKLPPRCGLICSDDKLALLACSRLQRLKRRIPHEIGVIGVGNHPLTWQSKSSPTVTSIDTDPAAIAEEGALRLFRILKGENLPPAVLKMPPRAVMVRQSTQARGSYDRIVADAVAIIRARACQGLQVPDLCKLVGVGRRSLERRFRTTLNSTIDSEIRLAKVREAKWLLAQSKLSISRITKATGFCDLYYFSTAFKKETGLSPGEFREQVKLRQ